jgi:hypothetical protein
MDPLRFGCYWPAMVAVAIVATKTLPGYLG